MLGGVLVAAHLALYASDLGGETISHSAALLMIVPMAAGVVTAVRASERAEGRERLLWYALAAMIAGFLVGMAVRAVALWSGRPPFELASLGSAGFAVGLVFVVPMTVLLADSSALSPLRRAGDTFDFAAVLACAAAIATYVAWLPTAPADSLLTRSAFVALSVIALAPPAYALVFKHGRWAVWYGVLAAGLCGVGAGGSLTVLLISLDAYSSGSWQAGAAEVLMFSGFALLAMAGLHRMLAESSLATHSEHVVRWSKGRTAAAAALAALGFPSLAHLSSIATVGTAHDVIIGWAAVFAACIAGRGATLAMQNTDLASQAMTDPMTGLQSSPHFAESLAREARLACETGSPLSVCVFAAAGLADVNRSEGYAAGDGALRRIASGLLAHAGTAGAAGRIAGDTFGLLLPGSDGEAALAVCQEALRTAFDEGGAPPGLRMSVGVADIRSGATCDPAELMRSAQDAAYWSREMAGGDVVVFDPLLVKVLDSREDTARLEQETHAKTVEALAAAVDARDRYSRGHSHRVADLAADLARAIGLSDARAEMVRAAGLLHDIGKIGVPERVLLKLEPLSAQERQAIEEHPVIAEKILHSTVRPEMLAWIRGHHERWDGTGYPDGLVGSEIPLEARILAVADSYESMVSERPYRAARTLEQAIAEMRGCAGSQFDPTLAEVFVEVAMRRADIRTAIIAQGTPEYDSLLHPTLPSMVVEVLDGPAYSPCLAVNGSFCEVLGYTLEQALRMTPVEFEADRRVSEQQGPSHAALEALRRGATPRVEREFRRPDGSVVDLELTFASAEWAGRPLLVITGRPLYVDPATRRAIERKARKLEALVAATRKLGSALTIGEILAEGAHCAVELAEVRSGGAGIVEPDGTVEFRYVSDGDGEPTVLRVGPEDPVCAAVLATRAPVTEIGAPADQRQADSSGRSEGFGLLALPVLATDGRVMAVLEVRNSLRAFFEDDVKLLRGLGAALAISIENAQALERLEERGRELSEQRTALRSLASDLALAEERERRVIANDLHDGIGQTLQISKMLVERAARSADRAEMSEVLENAESLLAQAINDTRTLMFELSPPVLYDIGLDAALEWLVDSQQRTTEAHCSFERHGGEKPLSETVRALVYRMTRELIINAVKHARAASIRVVSRRSGADVVIEVSDDGAGFDVRATPSGFGLRSLREQLGSLGGGLEIDSRPGGGTRALLRMPIRAGRV